MGRLGYNGGVMVVVAVTSVGRRNARRYVAALEGVGASARVLLPESAGLSEGELLRGAGGLLLSGGPDVAPGRYGQLPDGGAGLVVRADLDALEFGVLEYALSVDMPVLAICRGMQVLNVVFGGSLAQDLGGHRADRMDGDGGQGGLAASGGRGRRGDGARVEGYGGVSHLIYLAPGAKAAAVIGAAGFFRVNSYHHQGLFEGQRARRLMGTAYGVDDGLVEGLESPEHSWVIGLQCHPERGEEVPRLFGNLFGGLKERAELFLGD